MYKYRLQLDFRNENSSLQTCRPDMSLGFKHSRTLPSTGTDRLQQLSLCVVKEKYDYFIFKLISTSLRKCTVLSVTMSKKSKIEIV